MSTVSTITTPFTGRKPSMEQWQSLICKRKQYIPISGDILSGAGPKEFLIDQIVKEDIQKAKPKSFIDKVKEFIYYH